MGITSEQYKILRGNLNASRVAKRSQGSKELSYLESWDVRAHLIRVFGYGNFDVINERIELVYQRDVEVGRDKVHGWEVAYLATVRLRIRDQWGVFLCEYSDSAIGSAIGSTGLADLHDNASKTATSDALKRCAINLGTQYGLSLYDNGNRTDVVRGTVVKPDDGETDTPAADELTPEAEAALRDSLGAQAVSE